MEKNTTYTVLLLIAILGLLILAGCQEENIQEPKNAFSTSIDIVDTPANASPEAENENNQPASEAAPQY